MTSSFLARRGGGAIIVVTSLLAGASPLAAQPLTAAEAAQRALAQEDFLALGEAKRQEAEARVVGVRRLDNPEASVSREQVAGGGRSETEWQVGIVQPIDLSGRRTALRSAARAEASAVDADVARRRQERLAAVRRAYSGCASAEERAGVAKRYSARLREAERIVTARTQAGDTAGYDLRRVRVEAHEAAAQERLAVGEVGAECAALAQLSGTPGARAATKLADLLRAPGASGALARPDLLARQYRLTAATESVAAARARLPAIGVGVGYKLVDSESGSAGGPAISVGTSIPIFNNGRAAIAEARARQRAAQAELALARQDAAASVASARVRAEAASSAAEAAEHSRDDAARLGTIAEAAYQGGEGGVVELVDAYRAARDAERSIIEFTQRAVDAIIDLELAEGGLVP